MPFHSFSFSLSLSLPVPLIFCIPIFAYRQGHMTLSFLYKPYLLFVYILTTLVSLVTIDDELSMIYTKHTLLK
jgi:hypothetical protein